MALFAHVMGRHGLGDHNKNGGKFVNFSVSSSAAHYSRTGPL